MSLTVYILGGERLDYLKLQLKAIETNIKFDEIYYVQGPLSLSPNMASQIEFHPSERLLGLKDIKLDRSIASLGSYKARIRSLPPALMPQCRTDHALMLHGDLIPFAEFSVEDILRGKTIAMPNSLSGQWHLVRRDEQASIFELNANRKDDITFHGVSQMDEEQWDVTFNQVDGDPIPFQSVQIYSPSFIHLDDYCQDFQATIDKKLQAISRIF